MTQKSSTPIGVIAGTGVMEHFGIARLQEVETEFGTAQAFRPGRGAYWVLARHGTGHAVPPHRVNYRANIAALHKLGCRSVIATSAVGSMRAKFPVGSIGLLDQFLDFTKARSGTFYDDTVAHTDMTKPYSSELNSVILRAGRALRLKLQTGLVYVCAEGPRFETAAEIRMFRSMGGDVVGMTGVPEVVLADELGMRYSSIAIATNWAAGIQDKVSHSEVLKVMARVGPKVKALVVETVNLLGREE